MCASGILAEAKLFLSNPLVEDHVDRIWNRPAQTGDFFGDVVLSHLLGAAPSPKQKHHVALIGYLGYLFLFAYMFLTMPENVTGAFWTWTELAFWIMVGAQLVDEIDQVCSDFDGHLMQYMRASGNFTDVLLLGLLLLSFALRVAYNLVENIHVLETSMFVMSLTIVGSSWRVLSMLTVWQSMGIILKIVQRTVKKDIIVFLAFLTVLATGFIIGAGFYSWQSPQGGVYNPSVFIYMVAPVVDNVEYDLSDPNTEGTRHDAAAVLGLSCALYMPAPRSMTRALAVRR